MGVYGGDCGEHVGCFVGRREDINVRERGSVMVVRILGLGVMRW